MSYYFRDQLSIKTNKILANLFAEIILLSQKVQSFRQILSSVPYYDCVQLFRVLDRGEKGFLRLADFLNLMGESHKKVVTYAFSWFDQTKLGQVSRLQFISFLMPRRNQQLREMIARRIQEPVSDENFSTTINQQLNIFTELINQMISHELRIIEQRKLLLKQQDYSLKGVLHSLDSNTHDFVTAIDILKFLQNYAIKVTTEQIQDLLQIVDSRLTGKIKIEQLKWIIEGLQGQQKEYLNKIKSSMKGKTSRRKTYHEQESHTTEKQFVRTPLKSKQKNIDKKQLQKSRNYQSILKQSNLKPDLRQSHYEKSRIKEEKIQSFVKQIEPQRKKTDIFPSNVSNKFDEILQRYKKAETQAVKRDAELLRAQLQIKNKLRDQFQQKSNQRKRVMTQTKAMTAQRPYRDESPIYLPQRRFLEYQFSESRSRSRIRDLPHEYAMDLQYQHPYPSKYDSKINTIVENFYRRNHPGIYSDSNKKYGTLSGTFNYDRQRSQNSAYNLSINDRIPSYPSKFLQDSLIAADRVKPFNHELTLKKEINKKLGDDIFNIDLSHKKYDPSFHYARQKPLQQNIKRLKDTVKERQQNKNQLKTASPKMLENISIISKDTSSVQISSKPSPKIDQDFKSNKTQKKVRFAETPSSEYQSVSKAQPIQKKGFNTTQTRYPATDLKTIGSPLNYARRQL